MTTISTQHLIEQQIPYHIRESNPTFTKFLQYYYEFQAESKIQSIIQDIKKYNDIDAVEEEFLVNFFEEFRRLPTSILADKRLIAKHVYDLYQSKGSEQSLRLLFRIVYGAEIDLYYPETDILRASDGRWIQNSIITTVAVSGEVKQTSNIIRIASAGRVYHYTITKFESDMNGYIRLFFKADSTFEIQKDQVIRVYTDDQLDYVGTAILMPSYIEIEAGGGFWQVGQIVKIPGALKDTICQVKRTGQHGAIQLLQIVDYGYDHDLDSSYTVSPFAYRPVVDSFQVSATQLSSDVTAYTLNLTDAQCSASESLTATSNDAALNFNQSVYCLVDTSRTNPDFTMDQWIASRAVIQLKSMYSAKEAGYYESLKGHLSSPTIRLQDNFFYQLFSYVITSSRAVAEYDRILSTIHPAGMKSFGVLSKEVSIQAEFETSRIISNDYLLLSDAVEIDDSYSSSMSFTRTGSDYVVATSVDTPNNYDPNDVLALYDPATDWDEIVQRNATYNAQTGSYDIASPTYVEQYTQEDEKITVNKN